MFAEDCEHEFFNNVCQKCNLVMENNFDNKYTDTENAKDINKYSIIVLLYNNIDELSSYMNEFFYRIVPNKFNYLLILKNHLF